MGVNIQPGGMAGCLELLTSQVDRIRKKVRVATQELSF